MLFQNRIFFFSWDVAFENSIQNSHFDSNFFKKFCLYRKTENAIKLHSFLIWALVNLMRLWTKMNFKMRQKLAGVDLITALISQRDYSKFCKFTNKNDYFIVSQNSKFVIENSPMTWFPYDYTMNLILMCFTSNLLLLKNCKSA